ncbi:MAG: TonB family protein [Woeseiaceae bacterium]|nr:TonB family protein [Woeseiaceae bacterium]
MIVRSLSAMTGGIVITLALFFVMQALIGLRHTDPPAERERWSVEFGRKIAERPVETAALEPDWKKLTQPQEPTPPRPLPQSSGQSTGVTLTQPLPPDVGKRILPGTVFSDGPLVAVVRVEPSYPPRAAEQNLEGWVLVEFDVTADGLVSDPRVIESSHRVFEKAALRAAQKFRFKAKVVDGQPQGSHGIRNLFRFELERG